MGIDGTLMSPAPKTPSQRRSWAQDIDLGDFLEKIST